MAMVLERLDIARAGLLLFVSAGCLQLTGYPAECLARASEHSYGSLILAEYADYIWYCVQCALLQHEPYQLSYRIRCSGGQIKDVWEKGVGVYSADGKVLGIEGGFSRCADSPSPGGKGQSTGQDDSGCTRLGA